MRGSILWNILREMLSVCDYVLIATPLTPETKGMIGETELGSMKSSAVIINVGRGPVIVEEALIAALEQTANSRGGPGCI